MEVRCDRCRARYVIADEQVGDEGLAVRCSGCGHVFRVKRKSVVVTVAVKPDELSRIAPVPSAELDRAAASAAPSPAQPAAEGWGVRRRGGEGRAFKDLSELQKWVVEGNALPEDELSERGGPWRRLGEIPELQPFFAVVERARQNEAALPSRTQATLIEFPAAHARGGAADGAGASEPAFALPHGAEDGVPVLPVRLGPAAGETWEKTVPAAGGKEPAWAVEAKAGRGPRPVTVPPQREKPRRSIASKVAVALVALAALAAAGGAAAYFFWPNLQGALPPALLSFLRDRGLVPAESQLPAGPGLGPQPGASSTPAAAPAPSGAAAASPTPSATATPTPAATPAPAPTPTATAAPTATATATPAPAATPAATATATPLATATATPAATPTPTPTPAPAPTPTATATATPPATPPSAPEPAAAETGAEAPTARPKPLPLPGPAPARPEVLAPRPKAEAIAPVRPKQTEPEEPRGIKPLLLKAKRLRQLGRASEALDAYARAIAQEPGNAAALAGRGLCYLDLSDYAQAEASFASALQADARSADALMGLAETYRYEGRRGEAVTYYHRYLAAHPDGEDAVAARNAIRALKE